MLNGRGFVHAMIYHQVIRDLVSMNSVEAVCMTHCSEKQFKTVASFCSKDMVENSSHVQLALLSLLYCRSAFYLIEHCIVLCYIIKSCEYLITDFILVTYHACLSC